MGGIESKLKIRKLVKSEVIGTAQLEELWQICGGAESIPIEKLVILIKEITKRMKIPVTQEQILEWTEQCRSSQGKYADNMVNFLHFKRLYLAVLYNTDSDVPLSLSLATLLPSCMTNLFGVSVEDATVRSHPYAILPKFIEDICNYLNENAKDQGLYRVPGSENEIQTLIQRIDFGETVELSSTEAACGLIVKFFKYSADGVYGPLNDQFRSLHTIPTDEERYEVFKQLLVKLPSANRELIQCLAMHFGTIESNQQYNKMNRNNLEICFQYFGPKVLACILDAAREPEVFQSTVKFGISWEEAAKRSPTDIPSPLAEIITFLQNKGQKSALALFSDPITPEIEFRSREIAYLLNDNKPLETELLDNDIFAALLTLKKFLASMKDSIWGSDAAEQQLVELVDAPDEEFKKVFEALPPVNTASALALAGHIKLFSDLQPQFKLQRTCDQYPMFQIPKLMPVLIRLYLKR